MQLHQTSASLIREFTLHGLMTDKMTSYSQRNHICRSIGLGNGSHRLHLWGTRNCKRENWQRQFRCDRKCWLEGSWPTGEADVAGGSFSLRFCWVWWRWIYEGWQSWWFLQRERELHSVGVIADGDFARVNQASFFNKKRTSPVSCLLLFSGLGGRLKKKNNAAH